MNCVKGEIHNVLSMMRVNARWASSARFRQEIPASTQSPLMRAFKQLHYELQAVTDLSDVDTVTYLLPFIMVIESDKTSGFITGTAIASLNKFLLYRLITADSLRADVAINRLAICISRCRFEETHRADDEAVLMKLLEMAEYTLRSDAGHLISGENVWKMIQLCYSIALQPRSSIHLKRAAENTLAHLILTVFGRIDQVEPLQKPRVGQEEDDQEFDPAELAGSTPTTHTQNSVAVEKRANAPYGVPLMEQILQFLSGLIAPSVKDDAICALGLRLINIVLETAGTGLGQHSCIVFVLQGDLSKYLLQNSETEDLAILSLTLRVVFNLFNSIKDHLKVQLEVFFTSVHMRIIDSPSCSDEQKELALESLLEFCREPALMLDLYINYDCDVHCTNLFEVLCKSLARNCQVMEKTAATTGANGGAGGANSTTGGVSGSGNLNALTLLCLEGLLAVIESIARRCPLNSNNSFRAPPSSLNSSVILTLEGSQLARFTSTEGGGSSNTPHEELSPRFSSIRDLMQLVMSDSESEDQETESDTNSSTSSLLTSPGPIGSSSSSDHSLAWLHTARERTAEVLQQRKRTKKRYALAAEKFNTDQKNWVSYSQQLGLLPTTDKLTPESVASFLLHTPGLNKTLIGDYLGDGPIDKYPFNAAVREAYVALFDFRETKSLDEALRMFLAKFRLPGEAQKIDRMMECFSKHFYLQTSKVNGEKGVLVDADAAYVLSFSIIMLNTDLHNDQVAKKMSLEEFVRNNRGINGGKDLPVEYLTALYQNIQRNQIQMQHDPMSDLQNANAAATAIDRYSSQWDGVLKRQENVVGASFTSNSSILKLRAGTYEKEMFTLIKENTINSILLAFEKTCDVTNMERALEGLSNCAKIALYYDMRDVFNKAMASLSSYFLTFSHGILNGEKVFLPPPCSTSGKNPRKPERTNSKVYEDEEDDHEVSHHTDDDDNEQDHEEDEDDLVEPEIHGALTPTGEEQLKSAKTRRALLSLKMLFQFVQSRNEFFRKEAWSSVVECILMMNELDVVPISLVEMDDFVDSRGVPLPTGQPTGSTSPSAVSHSIPPPTAATTTGGATAAGTAGNTGVSGKTRERSRRVAERQAAIRSRMRNMGGSNYSGNSYGSSSSGPSSGSIWGSLSSYLWAEEQKHDESFDLVNRALKEHVIKLGGGLLEKENWLRMGRKLNQQSLTSLLETLLSCRDPFKRSNITTPSGTNPTNLPPADPMMQENAMLVLELSVDLILVNAHRILGLDLWLQFDAYARRLLTTPLKDIPMQLLVERVVVHVLRVSIRLFHDEKLRSQVMKTLKVLLEMEEDMYKILSDRIACGINMLLKANLVYMQEFHEWNVLLGILENVVQFKNGRAACWESVKLLAEGGHLNQENVTLWIAICLRFVSCRTPYSVDALRLLQGLASSDSVYKMESTWLEVMRVMLSYLNDDRAAIAKTAWDCLYKSLLLPGVSVPPETWKKCFEEVIFAFDDQVKEGMWRNTKEAPLYSITLLSKSFLHNVQALLELPDFRDLWLNVLTRLAIKVAPTAGSGTGAVSGHSPPMSSPSHAAMIVFETTLQSMYNLLLVLKAEKILDPSSEIKSEVNGKNLYEETCEIIERICPHLKEQLGLVEEEPSAPILAPTPAAAVDNTEPTTPALDAQSSEYQHQLPTIPVKEEAQMSTTATCPSTPIEEPVQVPVAPSSAPVQFIPPSPIITHMNDDQESLAFSSGGMETIVLAQGIVGVKVDEIIVDEITEAV